jgi:hypothetical protein
VGNYNETERRERKMKDCEAREELQGNGKKGKKDEGLKG